MHPETAPNFAPLDRGVRLVSVTGQCRYDEDGQLPFRVHIVLSVPQFMEVAFILMHGGAEEIVARAESLEMAEDFIKRENLEKHPRFRRLAITGPDVKIERSRERGH